jgi:hypothetical protein
MVQFFKYFVLYNHPELIRALAGFLIACLGIAAGLILVSRDTKISVFSSR